MSINLGHAHHVMGPSAKQDIPYLDFTALFLLIYISPNKAPLQISLTRLPFLLNQTFLHFSRTYVRVVKIVI